MPCTTQVRQDVHCGPVGGLRQQRPVSEYWAFMLNFVTVEEEKNFIAAVHVALYKTIEIWHQYQV